MGGSFSWRYSSTKTNRCKNRLDKAARIRTIAGYEFRMMHPDPAACRWKTALSTFLGVVFPHPSFTPPTPFPQLRCDPSSCCCLRALFATASGEPPVDAGFPAGIRIAENARGEKAIAALGDRLPEVAAFHGKSARQLREIFRKDDSLWINTQGRLFYACPPACEHCVHEAPEATDIIAESIGPTDPGPFDTSEAFLLHSRPGANRVIYLDFDGHVDNTPGYWKAGASAPPYNIPNSDPNTFSTEERNRIIEIWQRVAEDFSMYDINVTTEEPPIEDLRKPAPTMPATASASASAAAATTGWQQCGRRRLRGDIQSGQ
jgi:hypothetical protein